VKDSNPFLDAALALDRVKYARKVMGLQLYDWQIAILTSDRKRKAVDASRQAGKSSVVAPVATHTAKFRRGSLTIIQASTLQQASWDMSKIKNCIGNDPTYPALKRESDSLIELENGSRIEVIPATEKSAQGASAPAVIILDEASDIDDEVVSAGVVPMLTNNPECEFILISTPHGRSGFFFRSFSLPQMKVADRFKWERFFVRSPWTPTSITELERSVSEEELKADYAKRGIRAWYSPRHMNYEEQIEQLFISGTRLYLQEHCAAFVEPESMVFSYDDIKRAFDRGEEASPLMQEIRIEELDGLESF